MTSSHCGHFIIMQIDSTLGPRIYNLAARYNHMQPTPQNVAPPQTPKNWPTKYKLDSTKEQVLTAFILCYPGANPAND